MIDLLVKEIKKKKEFQNLDNSFVRELVKKDYDKDIKKLTNHPKPEKTKEFKKIIKGSRKILHDIYGVFNIQTKKRKTLLNEIKKTPQDLELHRNLLETHRSSKERLFAYEEIYKRILDKEDKIILDIGCGLNPLSWIFMPFKPKKYIATELTKEDCDFLNKYFSVVKINGHAIQMDLLKVKELPKADVCLILKVLDSLEEIKKNISKELLKKINCKKIVVSFPLRTISGKNKIKKRIWFERLVKEFEKFETENEVFYILKKENIY